MSNEWYGRSVQTPSELCTMLSADDDTIFFDIMTRLYDIKAEVKDIAAELGNQEFNTTCEAFMVGARKRYIDNFFESVTDAQWEDSRDVLRCSGTDLDALRVWLLTLIAPEDDIEILQRISMDGAVKVPKGTWRCPWHECKGCERNKSHVGGMLFQCVTCPLAYCFDCCPEEYLGKREPFSEYKRRLETRGYNTQTTIFFKCATCVQAHILAIGKYARDRVAAYLSAPGAASGLTFAGAIMHPCTLIRPGWTIIAEEHYTESDVAMHNFLSVVAPDTMANWTEHEFKYFRERSRVFENTTLRHADFARDTRPHRAPAEKKRSAPAAAAEANMGAARLPAMAASKGGAVALSLEAPAAGNVVGGGGRRSDETGREKGLEEQDLEGLMQVDSWKQLRHVAAQLLPQLLADAVGAAKEQ
eukprot:gene21082-25310_t